MHLACLVEGSLLSMCTSSLMDAPASPVQPPLVLKLDRGPRPYQGGSSFPRRREWGRRVADLAAAVTLLAITLPVMALAALAIRLESPGPILRREAHVGQGGRVFHLMTFRSTRGHGAQGEAAAGEAALTRVGQLLQPPRIDQLPILFNLLRGDMTLIGPAPRRHDAARPRGVAPLARPGVSGWAAQN